MLIVSAALLCSVALLWVVPADAQAPAAGGAAKPAPLPANFEPPRVVPDQFSIFKPTMTADEVAAANKTLLTRRVSGVITAGDLTSDARQLIPLWAKVRFAEMTLLAREPREIPDITRKFLTDLRNAGTQQANENRQREFRDFFNAEVVKAAREVLDNHFAVRLQAVLILSRLNSKEASFGGDRAPAIGFAPAVEPLLGVLDDPKQLEAMKVAAVTGIGRIAGSTSIPTELRFRAAQVLVKELAPSDTHYWYQMRLAEAMAALNFDYDRNRKPVIYDALLAAVGDVKRPWRARSAAAKALGRIPLPAESDPKLLADRLVRFGQQMAATYNQAPRATLWPITFAELEATFKPSPEDDLRRLPNTSLVKRGTLTGPLDEAYKRILPLTVFVLKQQQSGIPGPIPADLTQPLTEYLAANKP